MIPAVVERSPLRGIFRCGFRTDSKNVLIDNTSGSAQPDATFVWFQYSIRKKESQAAISACPAGRLNELKIYEHIVNRMSDVGVANLATRAAKPPWLP